jgi:antirestriction protein ArdC
MAAGQIEHQGDLKSDPAIDKMIDDNLFFCPINQVKGDKAYYSPARDEIVIPTREQFVDGEAFATNTLHECAHATGAESRLNRTMGHAFGSEEYAKEELTAELSAALIASQHGLTKHVKNDSAAYLKSWLGSLQQGPDFLKTVLSEVKRCTGMINQRLDAIQLELDKGEKADFSLFRPGASAQEGVQLAIASKQVEEEWPQVHQRSR